MTDMSFNFELWLAWREFIFWALVVVGFVSAMLAYVNYDIGHKKSTTPMAVFVMAGLVVALGFFPIEWGFGSDRANYAMQYIGLQSGMSLHDDQEYGFTFLSKLLSRFLNPVGYMAFICAMYLANYLITAIKLVRKKSYWLVVAVVISMGFTGYAINTIRAGLALSFLVLALGMYPNKWKMLCCLFIASSIHTSTLIPALMMVISYFFPSTRIFYYFWFISIPVSFVGGNYFMELFAGMSDDSRTSYLTDTENTSYNVGFRIDFIIYSLAPLVIGWIYIFKCRFRDRLYSLIYNSFILTNIFWILVIRANYSDRFAYLSWFLIPFVLVYPLLKQRLPIKENMWLGMILLAETVFKFFV